MIKINHRLDTVGDHLIEVAMIKLDCLCVRCTRFKIINQPRPLNGGTKRVEPCLLHPFHVIFEFTVGLANALRTNLLIEPLRLLSKPAVPDGTVCLTCCSFRLRSRCRSPPEKPFGKLIPSHNASFEKKRAAPKGRSQNNYSAVTSMDLINI